MPDRLRIMGADGWSGGGDSVLGNVELARRLYPDRFADDGVPIVMRNVVPRSLLLAGGYVYMPQNAWAWHGPAHGRRETIRRTTLRVASEVAARRAGRTIRIGPMIPDLPRSFPTPLPNVLDEHFETGLEEAAQIARPSWLPDGPYVLAPGSHWSYRNIDTVTAAHTRYLERGGTARLVLVGPPGGTRGTDVPDTDRGVVDVRARVPRRELLAAILAADVVVFGSLVEASPVTLLEAVACRRPVIAWDQPGYRFIVEEVEAEGVRFVSSSDEMVEALYRDGTCTDSPIADRSVRAAARRRWVDEFIELAAGPGPTAAARTERFSSVAQRTRLPDLAATAFDRARPDHVRAVNFHDVPANRLPRFEEQLDYLLARYQALGIEELRAFFDGSLRLDRPGLILTFDDGLVSHVTDVVDALDRRGVPGWFFVPTGAIDVPAADQFRWAVDRELLYPPPHGEPHDIRVFATWDELRALHPRHVIGSHTHLHTRFAESVPADAVAAELTASFDAIARELGRHDRCFCWVGGELASYSRTAADVIATSDVEFGFTTSSAAIRRDTPPLRLDRTNIEATFSMDRTRLALSGAADLRHRRRRRQLDPVFAAR